MEDESTTPTSVDSSNSSVAEKFLHRVCFLDLDDTLIPTTWMRAMYETKAALNPPQTSGGIDLALYQSVKAELDETVSVLLGRPIDVDHVIIEFLETLATRYHTVIVVTNARSHTWVATFQKTFPRLAARMAALQIKIIKTTPSAPEPPWCSKPQEYFDYWSSAKLFEFEQVIKKINEVGKALELACVGDNNFEHYAFIQLCEKYKPTSAHIIKCTCGLRPKSFIKQIRSMTHCVAASRGHGDPNSAGNSTAAGNLLPDSLGLDNVMLSLESSRKHIQSVTWSYEPVRDPAEDISKPGNMFRDFFRKAIGRM